MADLSDVVALLAQMADAALYPNGDGQASAVGASVRIFPGWPVPDMLDADLKAGNAQVSVYSTVTSSATFQVQTEQYTITPPVYGLTASVAGEAVTLSGTPGTGEFASVIVNNSNTYSHGGLSVAAILAAILSDATTTYPGVSVSGNTITFPNSVHSLVCQLGAPGFAGFVTHRQKATVMVTVWAPTPAVRDSITKVVDAAIKATNRVTFPDTSQGQMRALHTRPDDTRMNVGEYRRDLFYEVEYATLTTYPVVEITTFGATNRFGEYGLFAPDITINAG